MEFECTQKISSEEVLTDVPNEQKGVLILNGTSYPVFEGSNKIGRDESCSICIPNNVLSKRHAVIHIVGDTHQISDLESLNKTFVESDVKPLIPYISVVLNNGAKLRFGNIEGVYKFAEVCEEEENDNNDLPTTQMVRPVNPITLDGVFDDSIEVPETPSGSEDESIINRTNSPDLSILGSNLRNSKAWIHEASTQIRIPDEDLSESSQKNQYLTPNKTTPSKKSSETLESPYFIEKLCLSESGPETFDDNKIIPSDNLHSSPKNVFLAPETQSVSLLNKNLINVSVPETQNDSVASTCNPVVQPLQSVLHDSDSNDEIICYKEDCHTGEINYEASQSIIHAAIEQQPLADNSNKSIDRNILANIDESTTDCESWTDISKKKINENDKVTTPAAKKDNDSTDCEDVEDISHIQVKGRRGQINRKRMIIDSTDSEEDISDMKTQKFHRRVSKIKNKKVSKEANSKVINSEDDVINLEKQKLPNKQVKEKESNVIQVVDNANISKTDSEEDIATMHTQKFPKPSNKNKIKRVVHKQSINETDSEEDIANMQTQKYPKISSKSRNNSEKVVDGSSNTSEQDIVNMQTQLRPELADNCVDKVHTVLSKENDKLSNTLNNTVNSSDIFNQETQLLEKSSSNQRHNETSNSEKDDILNLKTQIYSRISSSPVGDIVNMATQIAPVINDKKTVTMDGKNIVNSGNKKDSHIFKLPEVANATKDTSMTTKSSRSEQLATTTKETMHKVLKGLEDSFDSDNDEIINILQNADADDSLDNIYCMQETEVIQDNDAMTTSTPLVANAKRKTAADNVKGKSIAPKKGRGKKSLFTSIALAAPKREPIGRTRKSALTNNRSNTNTDPSTSSGSNQFVLPVEDFMDAQFTEGVRSETSLLNEFSKLIPKKKESKGITINPEKEFVSSDEDAPLVSKPRTVFKYKTPPKSKAKVKSKSPVQNARKSSRKVSPKKVDEVHRQLKVVIEKTEPLEIKGKTGKGNKIIETRKKKLENKDENVPLVRNRSKTNSQKKSSDDITISEDTSADTSGRRPLRMRKKNSKYDDEPEQLQKTTKRNKKGTEKEIESFTEKVTKIAPESSAPKRRKRIIEQKIKSPVVNVINISDDSLVVYENSEVKSTRRSGGVKRQLEVKEIENKAPPKRKKPNSVKGNLENHETRSNISLISTRTRNHLNSISNTSVLSTRSSCRIQEHEKYKVLFTSMDGVDALTKKVKSLGGKVVEDIEQCTILITSRIVRTVKFLCCLAKGVPIVGSDWVNESHKKKEFVDPSNYILKDKTGESRYKFSLERSLNRVKEKPPILQGYTVMATPNTIPSPADLKGIIEWCGGTLITKTPSGAWPDDSFIVSTPDDKKYWPKSTPRKKIPVIVSMEAIMQGILQFNLNIKPYTIN